MIHRIPFSVTPVTSLIGDALSSRSSSALICASLGAFGEPCFTYFVFTIRTSVGFLPVSFMKAWFLSRLSRVLASNKSISSFASESCNFYLNLLVCSMDHG
jgi:hypothetical protein